MYSWTSISNSPLFRTEIIFPCWGGCRGVNIITRLLGLRMPEIPFPRTSILKISCGMMLLDPLSGDRLWRSVSRTPFSKIPSPPQPWICFFSHLFSAVSKYFFVVVSLSSLSRGSTVYQYIILNNHMFHVQVFYHNSQINQRFFVKK